jgi:hypothetical protein
VTGVYTKSKAHPIVCNFRLQPCGKSAGSLDEQEFAITVHNLDPNVLMPICQLPEKVYNHPLVLNRVAVVGTPVK